MRHALLNGELPIFDTRLLPEAERSVARIIEANLMRMNDYVKNFHAAIDLFESCAQQIKSCIDAKKYDTLDKWTSWQFIAARDGAMTIYHFGKAMSGTKSSLRLSPTLKSSVNSAKLKSAGRLFTDYFPEQESVRNAVAHSGELANTTESLTTNAFDGSYKSDFLDIANASDFMIQDSLQGRLFTTSYRGKIITYEIGYLNLIRLNGVKEDFYSAFFHNQLGD
jgi:hypothetical protein